MIGLFYYKVQKITQPSKLLYLCLKMHSQMAKLYNNVIDDFMTLVEKQYKGKNVFSNDDLDKMKKSLKSKMKDTEEYNKKIIYKFFDEAMEFAQQPQTKQVNKNNDISSVKFQQNGPLQLVSLNLKKSNSQQQQDDLNQFKKHKNSKQKQIHKQTFQPLKFNEDDLFQFDQEDLDQKLTVKELESIKQNTGLHILGQYNTKQKKFNSKKQQTRFTVYNALLKIQGHDQEVLFPVVQLVTKRIQKSKIPI